MAIVVRYMCACGACVRVCVKVCVWRIVSPRCTQDKLAEWESGWQLAEHRRNSPNIARWGGPIPYWEWVVGEEVCEKERVAGGMDYGYLY